MPTNDIAIRLENVSKVYRLGVKDETEESLVKSFAKIIKSPMKNYRKYRSLSVSYTHLTLPTIAE